MFSNFNRIIERQFKAQPHKSMYEWSLTLVFWKSKTNFIVPAHQRTLHFTPATLSDTHHPLLGFYGWSTHQKKLLVWCILWFAGTIKLTLAFQNSDVWSHSYTDLCRRKWISENTSTHDWYDFSSMTLEDCQRQPHFRITQQDMKYVNMTLVNGFSKVYLIYHNSFTLTSECWIILCAVENHTWLHDSMYLLHFVNTNHILLYL